MKTAEARARRMKKATDRTRGKIRLFFLLILFFLFHCLFSILLFIFFFFSLDRPSSFLTHSDPVQFSSVPFILRRRCFSSSLSIFLAPNESSPLELFTSGCAISAKPAGRTIFQQRRSIGGRTGSPRSEIVAFLSIFSSSMIFFSKYSPSVSSGRKK